jgi:hypothetical protein
MHWLLLIQITDYRKKGLDAFVCGLEIMFCRVTLSIFFSDSVSCVDHFTLSWLVSFVDYCGV